jgi:hypothetical protein
LYTLRSMLIQEKRALDQIAPPVGLQVVGRALGEYDVVCAAAAYEQAQPASHNVRSFDEGGAAKRASP